MVTQYPRRKNTNVRCRTEKHYRTKYRLSSISRLLWMPRKQRASMLFLKAEAGKYRDWKGNLYYFDSLAWPERNCFTRKQKYNGFFRFQIMGKGKWNETERSVSYRVVNFKPHPSFGEVGQHNRTCYLPIYHLSLFCVKSPAAVTLNLLDEIRNFFFLL